MSFLEQVRARVRTAPRSLVFPEGQDSRIQEAALYLAGERLLRPVLLAPPSAASSVARAVGAKLEVRVPEADPERELLAERLLERRRARGMSVEEAWLHSADPLVFGALLTGAGMVDGSVAGAANPTGAVLRAALWCVGTAAGITTVSSSFYMLVPPFRGIDEEVLTFTDAAVVPFPSAEQLAEIALAAARARSRVVGDRPRVAFLSYSTRGSASGKSVERVRAALALFRERAPGVPADGEMQADAALIRSVGERKAPGSDVAGGANILVFPDLDSGNIAYKLVQRLARAKAVGPIVQGLAKPCNDLSRGATVDDIVSVACITALPEAP